MAISKAAKKHKAKPKRVSKSITNKIKGKRIPGNSVAFVAFDVTEKWDIEPVYEAKRAGKKIPNSPGSTKRGDLIVDMEVGKEGIVIDDLSSQCFCQPVDSVGNDQFWIFKSKAMFAKSPEQKAADTAKAKKKQEREEKRMQAELKKKLREEKKAAAIAKKNEQNLFTITEK